MADGLALGVVALGILAAVGVGVLAGLRTGVSVLLDFLLAAGLLRLTVDLGWTAIGGVAVVIAVRQVLARGLRQGGRPNRPTAAVSVPRPG